MVLAIISHTEHYVDSAGNIVGWGATIREVNHVASIFDKVYHVAPLYNGKAPSGMLTYEASNVEFVPLRPSGGEQLKDKFSVLAVMPHNLAVIRQTLKKCDVFQFRAPTGMGVYVIPYLLLSGKKGWFKYAGNWGEPRPPKSYSFQRLLLRKQHNYKVTINGRWANQSDHLLTFENPCLTEEERMEGKQSVAHKDFSGKLDFVFIGRLEDAKGVHRILEVLSKVVNPRIGKVHLIGDGSKREEYEKYAKNHCKQEIIFHGFLKKDEINKVLSPSHVFLLPSDSEGFPKVVAEAANFGLIPIVSDVSCIGQYVIEGETGYLIPPKDTEALEKAVCKILDLSEEKLSYISRNCFDMASSFTFGHYNDRIKALIVDK